MKSTTNSSKILQCPPISEELVDWLAGLHTPITNTLGNDIRELDFKSGQLEVVAYLRSQLDKQRS